ncbi:MAG TPA: NapC/NirT family cytochrome c [Alphaproteobacteria bacterium]|nr:NapC/NirT family cytochrome c [Alphaproteobacteria bacterium]
MTKFIGVGLLLAGVTLAVIVGLGWGVMVYTATPDFCNSCHVMNTRYVSWRRSPHMAAATCIECHSEPGWWGELRAHLNGARYLVVLLTGEMSGPLIRAEVSDASCLECHPAAQLPETVRNHRILHTTHLARGLHCADCHAGLVHGTLYGGQARPAMTLCVECHARHSPLLAACQTCHVQMAVPAAGFQLVR